jgi:hypothetical protein
MACLRERPHASVPSDEDALQVKFWQMNNQALLKGGLLLSGSYADFADKPVACPAPEARPSANQVGAARG